MGWDEMDCDEMGWDGMRISDAINEWTDGMGRMEWDGWNGTDGMGRMEWDGWNGTDNLNHNSNLQIK